jgi:hypothetical protein
LVDLLTNCKVMKKYLFPIILLALAVGLSACEIDYVEDPPVSPTPNPARAIINSSDISFTRAVATRPAIDNIQLDFYVNQTVEFPKIRITLNKSTAGTYTSANATVSAVFSAAANDVYVGTSQTINLTVLTISYVSGGVVSGTFSFEGVNASAGLNATISNGAFTTTFTN